MLRVHFVGFISWKGGTAWEMSLQNSHACYTMIRLYQRLCKHGQSHVRESSFFFESGNEIGFRIQHTDPGRRSGERPGKAIERRRSEKTRKNWGKEFLFSAGWNSFLFMVMRYQALDFDAFGPIPSECKLENSRKWLRKWNPITSSVSWFFEKLENRE